MRLCFGSYRTLRAFGFGLMSILLLGSCGDDGVVTGMPGGGGGGGGGGRAPAAAPATPEAAAGGAGARRGVTPLSFDTEARDPFTRPYPQSFERAADNLDDDPGQPDQENLGPLAPYPIETLRLVGILSRSARPMAIFRTPESSTLAEFAFIGDRVGPNGVGFIEDIQPNRVIVAYEGDPSAPPRRLPVFLRNEEGPFEVDFELIER